MSNMHEEIWRDIEGYNGEYQVSNYGRIKSFKGKGRIRKLSPGSDGYPQVGLSKNGVEKTESVHVLVAKAFIPNPENLPEVNHKVGNKKNNKVENLEWCTHPDNMKHAYDNSLMSKGEKHGRAKLSDLEVKWIRYWVDKGYKQKEIAEKFGISHQHVSYIKNNKTRKGVTYE